MFVPMGELGWGGDAGGTGTPTPAARLGPGVTARGRPRPQAQRKAPERDEVGISRCSYELSHKRARHGHLAAAPWGRQGRWEQISPPDPPCGSAGGAEQERGEGETRPRGSP